MTDVVYRRYMLVLLLVILAFNYLDRVALGLLMQEIKLDLGLSDTQLGILSGIAFAVFYSLMGIPLARWADRGNRVNIIAITTGLWSGAVALCGLATSFVQLLAARVIVAVGEAGALPPAHSLIADIFSRAERPRAVAIYMLGLPLSSLLGYFAAGHISTLYGWRTTFILMGLPGLVIALIAWRTLREPRSRGYSATPVEEGPGIKETLGTLLAIRSFRHLLLCFSIVCLFGYGVQMWQPSFFIRSFGVTAAELGIWLALILGGCSFLGTWLGGEMATRFAANDESRQLHVMGSLYASFGILSAGVYLVPSYAISLLLLAIATIGGSMTNAPLLSTIQTLVPPRMRATSIAILYLFGNLIGMGLGPLAAGMLSDALQPVAGEESLRYALLMLCPGYAWAGWHLILASRSIGPDIAARNTPVEI